MILPRLLLLFIVVPAIELGLLIQIGTRIGTAATLGLIVVTGIAGAALARQQGMSVLRRVQAELGAGKIPGAALVDALLILIAGALLMTPGLLTDALGFAFLVPPLRSLVRQGLLRRLRRAVEHGRVRVTDLRDLSGAERWDVDYGDGEAPVEIRRDDDSGPA